MPTSPIRVMTIADLQKWLDSHLPQWEIAKDTKAVLVNGCGRVKVISGQLYIMLTVTNGIVDKLDGC